MSATDFTRLFDLASSRLGGKAVLVNDEFFAPKENLLKAPPAVFLADKFTSRGKWMDGWETRRRRTPGHDWCVVRLGLRGAVRGVVVDTAHFLGNYPESCSIEAFDAPRGSPSRAALEGSAGWATILAKSPLEGDRENPFEVTDPRPWTHLRLNIFPDGGVARLRVHGEVAPDWDSVLKGKGPWDLAAVEHGGVVELQSDMFFGRAGNMLMPGRAKNMGDGWETKRRRGPGHDWAVVRLGRPGAVERIEVDTNHFKGNYPDACMIEGCRAAGTATAEWAAAEWREMLPPTKLKPHHRHLFSRELKECGLFSHVRVNIYPDGGISRLRLYGRPG